MSRESSVGVAIGYGLDGPGIECRWGRGLDDHPTPPSHLAARLKVD
jgi:hypothetical protein